jgi:hypothetical protein
MIPENLQQYQGSEIIREVAEAVDHGAVTGNFCVGRSVICEFLGKSSFKDMNGLDWRNVQ